MEKLAKALESRGFLIKQETDHIYFSHGNLEADLPLLKKLFNDLGCGVTVEERRICVNEPLTEEQLHKITWYAARNHEAGGGPGWRTWKYFSKRNHGPKVSTFSLETGVALLVKALSAAGIITINSCDGHGKSSPKIWFCGRQNAIWFNILFQEAKEHLDLTYEWKLETKLSIDPLFEAHSLTGRWNHLNVLEDTKKIAEFFLENALEISATKREIFGKQLKSTRKVVKQLSDDQLHEWMERKYNQYKEVKIMAQ